MASRHFVDSQGTEWRVWNTVPPAGSLLSADFVGGWLTFECGSCLKRLAPIPAGWESLTLDRLELLCRVASEVPRHTGPMPRMQPADRDDPAPGAPGAPGTPARP